MASLFGHPISDWIDNRGLYSYIPGKLIKSAKNDFDFEWDGIFLKSHHPLLSDKLTWGASTDLDNYHHSLLTSSNDQEILVGFLSVIFWGYISGADGVVRKARALSKVRAFRDGIKGKSPTPKSDLISIIKTAREFVGMNDLKNALHELMKIKYLGMSFSSKIIMFMDPDKSAVYDSIIASQLESDLNLDFLYINTTGSSKKHKINQSKTYKMWCDFCRDTAILLNEKNAQWIDWNGKCENFRAVDVERAFFALGKHINAR